MVETVDMPVLFSKGRDPETKLKKVLFAWTLEQSRM